MILCLPGVLQEIQTSYDEEKISQLSESALRLLEELSSIEGRTGERGVAVKLQGSGIGLWNKAVALKSAGAISPYLNAQSRLCRHIIYFILIQRAKRADSQMMTH